MVDKIEIDLRKMRDNFESNVPEIFESRESREKSLLISMLDPYKIIVGGIGCVILTTTNEYERRRRLGEEESQVRAVIRNILTSVSVLVHFFGGGLVYTFTDRVIQRLFQVRTPWSSGPAGAITAILCCSRTGNGIVWWTGSVIFMALFCQVAEWADYALRRGGTDCIYCLRSSSRW